MEINFVGEEGGRIHFESGGHLKRLILSFFLTPTDERVIKRILTPGIFIIPIMRRFYSLSLSLTLFFSRGLLR